MPWPIAPVEWFLDYATTQSEDWRSMAHCRSLIHKAYYRSDIFKIFTHFFESFLIEARLRLNEIVSF